MEILTLTEYGIVLTSYASRFFSKRSPFTLTGYGAVEILLLQIFNLGALLGTQIKDLYAKLPLYYLLLYLLTGERIN